MTKITVPEDCDKAPKKRFIRDFNIAFAENNTEGILTCMSEDIRWNMIGNNVVAGKTAVRKELETMGLEKASELILHTIITHGDTAAANGEMKFPTMTVAFCDVYKFSGHDRNAKIKELTSYGVEVSS